MTAPLLEKFVECLREGGQFLQDWSDLTGPGDDARGAMMIDAADMLEMVLSNDKDPDRPTLHYVRGLLERRAAKAMGNSTQGSDADESQKKA